MSDERTKIALDDLRWAVEQGEPPNLGPDDARAILGRVAALEAALEEIEAECAEDEPHWGERIRWIGLRARQALQEDDRE